MPSHSSLTGADLHESKGVASAAVGQLYFADGAGSGTWVTLGASGYVKGSLTIWMDDAGTSQTWYVPMPFACTVNSIYVVMNAATSTNTTNFTVKNAAGTTMTGGTAAVTAGTAAGTVTTLTTTGNNTFAAGAALRFASDGGTTNNPTGSVTIVYTRTA